MRTRSGTAATRRRHPFRRRSDRRTADFGAAWGALSRAEREQVALLWWEELRRGWLPRAEDLEDAVWLLRTRRRP
jgi:hypothetical protein